MTALPALERIMQRVPGVQHTQGLRDALHVFANHPSASVIVVLTGGEPVGVICRDLIADVVQLPCYCAWIDRQCCLQFVSHPAQQLRADADVTELTRALAQAPHRHPAGPLVMTANGAYLGIVERQALMRAIAALQQRALSVVSPSGRKLAPDCPNDIASVDYSNTSHASESAAPCFRKH